MAPYLVSQHDFGDGIWQAREIWYFGPPMFLDQRKLASFALIQLHLAILSFEPT